MRELIAAGAWSVAADADSPDDIPGVLILGAVVGGLLLIAAIRGMFGRRK